VLQSELEGVNDVAIFTSAEEYLLFHSDFMAKSKIG
jgi:hypothetical protein